MSEKIKVPKVRTPGRGFAYLGAVLGGGVSIAANIAHSFVGPVGAPADWRPEPGAVVGAVFWPLALFVAVEIWSRVMWPSGWRFGMLRFAGLLPVAVVAAVVSYRHLSSLLGHYGEEDLTVWIGPLAVDGLMVMSTGALIATGARRAHQAMTAAGTPAQAVPAVVPPPVAPPQTAPDLAATVVTAVAPAARPVAEQVAAPVEELDAKPARAAKRQPSARDRVVQAVTRTPHATNAKIAGRLGLSEATVARHRRQPVDSVSTPEPPSTAPADAPNDAVLVSV